MRPAEYHVCPGCGVRLLAVEGVAPTRFNASEECWRLYVELSVYTLERQDRDFMHQIAVDAYAAQHGGVGTRPMTVAFALIGLYLVFEQGATGKQAQHMHMLLARRSKQWPQFIPPEDVGVLTVWDVLRAQAGVERDAQVRAWGRSVWLAWSAERARVQALIASVMGE